MDEEELFGAFGGGGAAAASASAGGGSPGTAAVPTPATPTGAAAAPPARTQEPMALRAPCAWAEDECLASVTYRRISDEDRATLERIFRSFVTPRAHKDTITPVEATVHYCQAYCLDYAGASSAESAAALPRPAYNLAFHQPLPLPQQAATPSSATSTKRQQKRQRPSFSGRYFDAEDVGPPPIVGQFSEHLRDLLGMGELDPPPFLHKMKRLGFPPGYLGLAPEEDQKKRQKRDDEVTGVESDDEALSFFAEAPERRVPASHAPHQQLVPLLQIPGLNAPPPTGADFRLWEWNQEPTGSGRAHAGYPPRGTPHASARLLPTPVSDSVRPAYS